MAGELVSLSPSSLLFANGSSPFVPPFGSSISFVGPAQAESFSHWSNASSILYRSDGSAQGSVRIGEVSDSLLFNGFNFATLPPSDRTSLFIRLRVPSYSRSTAVQNFLILSAEVNGTFIGSNTSEINDSLNGSLIATVYFSPSADLANFRPSQLLARLQLGTNTSANSTVIVDWELSQVLFELGWTRPFSPANISHMNPKFAIDETGLVLVAWLVKNPHYNFTHYEPAVAFSSDFGFSYDLREIITLDSPREESQFLVVLSDIQPLPVVRHVHRFLLSYVLGNIDQNRQKPVVLVLFDSIAKTWNFSFVFLGEELNNVRDLDLHLRSDCNEKSICSFVWHGRTPSNPDHYRVWFQQVRFDSTNYESSLELLTPTPFLVSRGSGNYSDQNPQVFMISRSAELGDAVLVVWDTFDPAFIGIFSSLLFLLFLLFCFFLFFCSLLFL